MRERKADVVVVGGGITGISAAWQLARRRHRVVLLEQFDLGHVRGSSHGASRIFRLAYDIVDYVRLAEKALPLWRQAEAELGTELLWTTGGLDLGTPKKLAPISEAMTAAGVAFERLPESAIAQRFQGLSVPSGWQALYQRQTGVLYADKCRLGLMELARRAGATIQSGSEVTRLLPSGEGVIVEASDGRYRADSVVVASAGWANRLLEPLNLAVPIRVTREHVVYYPSPQVSGSLPFIWHTSPFEFYGLPNGRSDQMKVGEHRAGPEVDPDDDPVFEEERLDSVRDFVQRCLRWIRQEPVGRETCLYASTPDDDFVLDREGQIVLAVGFGGHGFKFGPVIGEILADLVQGSATTFNDRFRRSRFDTAVVRG